MRSLQELSGPLPMSTTRSAPTHVAVTIGQLVVRPVYTACRFGSVVGSVVMSAP